MKQMRFYHLPEKADGHIFGDFLPGKEIYKGGLSFMKKGERSHASDQGCPRHVHDDCELFLFLQGRGVVEVDGVEYPAVTGDVFLIEPGEDHHIIAGEEDPSVTIWCHAR